MFHLLFFINKGLYLYYDFWGFSVVKRGKLKMLFWEKWFGIMKLNKFEVYGEIRIWLFLM